MNLAASLLAVGVARHYLWPHFPAELQGMASKGMGAMATLLLLALVYRANRSKPLALVLCWWAWEEAQTALCSLAYLAQPWTVEAGQGICSARVGFDLGAAGLLAIAAIAYRLIPVRIDSIKNGPSA